MSLSDAYQRYESPLSSRYASEEMGSIFSPHYKHRTWRCLWIALAKAERQLGLNISQNQIQEMETHVDQIDWDSVARHEKRMRHDVMAHIHAFAERCPLAGPIIHLGATSCYVTDNTELIQIQKALSLLEAKLAFALRQLASFAEREIAHPCLGYTHFQPAQLTTVGKRAALWMQDLLMDLQEMASRKQKLKFLGVKGATGTQASFLQLFAGDSSKVCQLEQLVAQEMGFERCFTISGQTYTRKQDALVLQALAGLGSSCGKLGNDWRLLAHLGELEEPFLVEQVGSSAMPHKKNPMRAERLCSLARFLISLLDNALQTHAAQWLERSLDDSANRRLCMSEAFLTADALVELLIEMSVEPQVHAPSIKRHVLQELPFLATEKVLMHGVQQGQDRQQLHERLRQLAHRASAQIKEYGGENPLFEWMEKEGLTGAALPEIGDPMTYIGRAHEQTRQFLDEELYPALAPYPKNLVHKSRRASV